MGPLVDQACRVGRRTAPDDEQHSGPRAPGLGEQSTQDALAHSVPGGEAAPLTSDVVSNRERRLEQPPRFVEGALVTPR